MGVCCCGIAVGRHLLVFVGVLVVIVLCSVNHAYSWILDTRFMRRVHGKILHWSGSQDNAAASFNTSLSIHFVWVSSHLGAAPHPVSNHQWNASMVEEWKDPRWPVTVWTDALVREHFPELVPTLERLAQPVWIADIVRYHVIDRFGGLYLDTDFYRLDGDILQLWRETRGSFAVCQDVRLEDAVHCDNLANGVFASPRDSPVLKCAKHIAMFNTLTALNEGKYAFDQVFTGPIVWARCALAHGMTVLQPFTFFPCPGCWGFRDCLGLDKRTCANVNFCRDMPNVYAQHLWSFSWE